MRKYLHAAIITAGLLLAASPAAASAASPAAAPVHVLTIKATGGTPVKAGAVLKVGLAKGSAVVFSLSPFKLTCKSASFTAKVTSNPAAPGTAKESVTSQKLGKCKITGIIGVTVKSIKISNLPYVADVSDSAGNPVLISGRSKTKPLKATVTVTLGGTPHSCSYKAASLSGHASNTGNTISFTKQKLTKAGGFSACPAKAFFSAKFGPVVDTSVTGNPKVFVN